MYYQTMNLESTPPVSLILKFIHHKLTKASRPVFLPTYPNPTTHPGPSQLNCQPLTIVLFVGQRRDAVDGELLLQPVVQPSIVLVPAAHRPVVARRNDTVCQKVLQALELFLLLRVLHLDGVCLRVRLPHGRGYREGGHS